MSTRPIALELVLGDPPDRGVASCHHDDRGAWETHELTHVDAARTFHDLDLPELRAVLAILEGATAEAAEALDRRVDAPRLMDGDGPRPR